MVVVALLTFESEMGAFEMGVPEEAVELIFGPAIVWMESGAEVRMTTGAEVTGPPYVTIGMALLPVLPVDLLSPPVLFAGFPPSFLPGFTTTGAALMMPLVTGASEKGGTEMGKPENGTEEIFGSGK